MTFKEKYLLAKKNGVEEFCRGDEVSRRISKVYPLSAQIAVLADRDKKPEEYAEFQTFREAVKALVDAEIAKIEKGGCGG